MVVDVCQPAFMVIGQFCHALHKTLPAIIHDVVIVLS